VKYLIKSFSDKVSAAVVFVLLFELAVAFGLAINCMYDYGFYTPDPAQYAFVEAMKSRTDSEVDNLTDYYSLYLKQLNGSATASELSKIKVYMQNYSRGQSNLLVIVSSAQSPHILCNFEDEKIDLATETSYQRYAESEAYYGDRDVKISVNIKMYIREKMVAHDSYMVITRLISIATRLRYVVIALFAVMALSALVVLGLLMGSMSVHDENEDVYVRFIDRIPSDVFGLIIGFIFVFIVALIMLTGVADVKEENIVLWNSIMMVLGLVVALLLMMMNLITATRIKRGHVFRETIVYRSIVRIRKLMGKEKEGKFKVPYMGKVMITASLFVFADLGLLAVFVVQFARVNTDRLSDFHFIYYVVIHALGVLMAIPALLMAVSNLNYIRQSGKHLAEGDLAYSIEPRFMFGDFRSIGRNLSEIQVGMMRYIEEKAKEQEARSELITNLSHDLKTPLTSIINYSDLLKRELAGTPRESGGHVDEYLTVLGEQSMKLDRLLESLIEISKVSSGDVTVNLSRLDLVLFLNQTADAFDSRLNDGKLTLTMSPAPEEVFIQADGELLWRVFENLMSNICKYSLESTRVYIGIEEQDGRVSVSFRNISKAPLNLSGEELLRRFKREDSSRHTEGYGLGLSIAKTLTELQGGTFDISVDGDLFKVVLTFDGDAQGDKDRGEPS